MRMAKFIIRLGKNIDKKKKKSKFNAKVFIMRL